MNTSLKQAFKELSKALTHLHKDLLMLEAKRLEDQLGQKLGPYELLNYSLNDASMAWLRKLSELIVNIDTIIDESPNLSAQDSQRVASEVLAVIEKPKDPDSEFWRKYQSYLTNPDIIMKHARVKDVLVPLIPSN